MSGNFNIDSDGTITVQFLGRVKVGGMTTKEIEAMLTKAWSEGFVKRPVVSVEITQYRSRTILVIGEVRTPGSYAIEGTMTLLEVIARAGSLTPSAGNVIILQRFKEGMAAAVAAQPGDPNTVEVTRISYDDLKEGRITSNVILQDNDTLIVPPAERYYINGFVKTPGSFVLGLNMTVEQAIAQAGGLSERGSTRGITITRKDKNGKEQKIENVKMRDLVKAGDTINVRQRRI
jgi:polysaccharide export outer membrane protein